jgi:cysteinyl-tRNA synthetase
VDPAQWARFGSVSVTPGRGDVDVAGQATARIIVMSDAEIDGLIAERLAARKAKNWAQSDRIRDELAKAGVILEDKPGGTTTWRRA